MNDLRFNIKRKIQKKFFEANLLADSLNKMRNFDANRLVVIDSIRVDEHIRLTITKRVKEVFPLMAGDTILVSQDVFSTLSNKTIHI